MISRATFLAAAVLLGGLFISSAAQAQDQPFTVNAGLADQGAKVWKSKSCDGCHTIGKGKRAGPDLAGLLERRSAQWLTAWLKDPTGMAKNDSIGKRMVKESQGILMPDFRLTDSQIESLVHYLARSDGA